MIALAIYALAIYALAIYAHCEDARTKICISFVF